MRMAAVAPIQLTHISADIRHCSAFHTERRTGTCGDEVVLGSPVSVRSIPDEGVWLAARKSAVAPGAAQINDRTIREYVPTPNGSDQQ